MPYVWKQETQLTIKQRSFTLLTILWINKKEESFPLHSNFNLNKLNFNFQQVFGFSRSFFCGCFSPVLRGCLKMFPYSTHSPFPPTDPHIVDRFHRDGILAAHTGSPWIPHVPQPLFSGYVCTGNVLSDLEQATARVLFTTNLSSRKAL